MFPDLLQLVPVVVGDQRLVVVQRLQRFARLDRVGVNDLVPDEILARFRRQVLDVGVDLLELRPARHVEARPAVVQRLEDLRRRVRLDRVVRLHLRHRPAERGIVPPDHVMVDHDDRRAVFGGERLQLLLRHGPPPCSC
jgi:hypothetical protein